MQQLNGLCLNCLGCNKLEDPNFIGTFKCKNYEGDKNELSQIWKQRNNSKWNKISKQERS